MDHMSLPSLVILVSIALVLSCRQNHRQTESHTHTQTEADDRYTHATTLGSRSLAWNSYNKKYSNFMTTGYSDGEPVSSSESTLTGSSMISGLTMSSAASCAATGCGVKPALRDVTGISNSAADMKPSRSAIDSGVRPVC